MYLVDTSVWVDYIKGKDSEAVEFLDSVLQAPMDVGITEQILVEILHGAKSDSGFDKLQRYFSTQRFYGFSDSRLSHQLAAQIYFKTRRKGITIRSSNDCLIAQCAIENDVILFHQDRDFIDLGKVVPQLRQKHFLD